ncbi:QcrA and Rieske domain-containing protein [Cumulibacter manganitolerans]|uniref:QcrA and Rieske domain-containing protein n=1 Tax=Cumulibacter manganitolerans TaxID=1884992 RepID=UPI0012955EF1|nr:Rieske (2Fe-2S) protein [Cumulibacter manganitolerans]
MSAPHDPEVARLGAATRRSFMAGTTAVAAAVALTACTGQGGGPQRAKVSSGDRIGRVDAVPVGGGRVFPKASIVITQPVKGDYVGLSAICTHQQCTLREVSNATIYCGCHGSEFTLEGKVQKGPATADLDPRKIKVDGDYFVVA